MTDTCRITKPGAGEPVYNPATGGYDDPAPVEVYGPSVEPHKGKCRIPRRASALTSTSSTGGTASWAVGEYPLDLPVTGSEGVEPGQTVTYLTAKFDASLVDRVFGVTEPSRQSQATVRRFRMKEVVGA